MNMLLLTPSGNFIPRRHFSYLIRIWQSSPDGPWRASAQSIQSGETLRFANLASFFHFLEEQVTTASASPPELPES